MDCVNTNVRATNKVDWCSESVGTIKAFAVGGNFQKNPLDAVGRYGAYANGCATLIGAQPKHTSLHINNQWSAFGSY